MTDDQSDTSYLGIGGGRQKVLDALDDKPRLEKLSTDEKHSLKTLCEALSEIAVENWSQPPHDLIEHVERVHNDLPADAQGKFVTDDLLVSRINTARDTFGTYRSRLRRYKEMPSPVEAGPARYPTSKLDRRQESYHRTREKLEEALDNVRAAVNGAKGRALETIGSSKAEFNESKQEALRESRREQFEAGDLVAYRNPRLHLGVIKRVNQKSVRVKRPNPRAGEQKRGPGADETEPDYRESRVALDSNHLTHLTSDEAVASTQLDMDTLQEAEERLKALKREHIR